MNIPAGDFERGKKPRVTSTLVSADKTNTAKKTSTTKKVQQRRLIKELYAHSASRPPLQDLDRNRQPESISTKTSEWTVASLDNESPLKPSEFKHIDDSAKVNFGRTLAPPFDPQDKLFPTSGIYFISTSNLKSKNKGRFSHLYASPIKPNPRTGMQTLIYPPKEVTLVKKTSEKRGWAKNSDMFSVDRHETTYLDDIINWLAKLEGKTTIRSDALDKISKHRNSRIILINWLMTVQENYALPSEIFFNTIRLFDCILVSQPIPTNMMQIVLVTIMWIVSKYEDNGNCIKLSTLKTICGGACDEEKFVEMERTLLIFLRCDLSVPNLMTFISYYLKKLGLKDKGKVYYGSLYILHCFTLTEVYPTSPLSFMAAGAVYLTIHILSPKKLELWALLKNSPIYYPSAQLEVMLKKMMKQIKTVQEPRYQYSQAFKNFSTTDNRQISVLIKNKIKLSCH